MDKNPASKQFSRLFFPVLIYWVIGFAAKFVAEVAILTPHMADIIGTTVFTQQELMENAMSYAGDMFKILMEYQVEIAAFGALLTIPYSFIQFRKDKIDVATQRKHNNNIVSYIKVAVLAVIACIGLNSIALMMNLAMIDERYQASSDVMYSAPFGIQIICLGIIIPVAEELMFRGVVYKRFRQYATFARAAVFSTLMFSLAHGNMVQMMYAFAIGMLLTYVYDKYDSFVAPVCLHVVVNITSLIVTEIGGFTWLYNDPMRMAVAAVLCAFLGSALFVNIRQMNISSDMLQDNGYNDINI